MRIEARAQERSRLRAVKLAIPSVLLLVLLLAPQAVWLQGRNSDRSESARLAGTPALIVAFVLPRLSLDCVLAVVEAIRTCSSPVVGGAVACGMAAIRILEVCP